MHEFELGPQGTTSRSESEVERDRFLKAAQAFFALGTAGVVVLCLRGLNPPALAIPLFLGVVSAMFAATSAGLFALLAQLHLAEADEDLDDDDHGPGGGSDEPPEPPGPVGGLKFDWERFEYDFRVYCDRIPARA